jgi:hypothetical protein
MSELPDPEIVDRYPPGSRLREFAERGLVRPAKRDGVTIRDIRRLVVEAARSQSRERPS